jgi:hypothetical protein
MLNNIHQYGNIEEIMDRIDHEQKGWIMKIKENFYTYMYKYEYKLIEKQKNTNEWI